mgnify:CR=1 FL=1
METEPITSNGAKKLQDELSDLINNKRQKVIQAIAEAREHGDLKENALSTMRQKRSKDTLRVVFRKFNYY